MAKILVVAYDTYHLETLSNILELSGFDIIRESDAKKVLEVAQNQNPSLIMLDIRMPEMSGYEIAKLLKSNDKTKETAVVIFSAEEKSGEVFKKVLEIGVEDFINITAGKEEILFRTRACLDRKKYINELKNTEIALRAAFDKVKETETQLIQAEKLNAVGQLASGVAHEVRNPLATALQAVNYLEKTVPYTKTDTFETLAVLKENIKRASEIVKLLLDFSKIGDLNLQSEDINSILEKSLELVKHTFKFEHIKIINETGKDVSRVLVDRNKIEQVFVNILLNAIEAMPKGGEIIIRSYDKQFEEIENGVGKRMDDYFGLGEKAVRVEIEDTGIGISEEYLKKVFDPFFTTKGSSGGIGLGLSVSQGIISLHRGLIDIKSKLGKGTKTIITLKIAEG